MASIVFPGATTTASVSLIVPAGAPRGTYPVTVTGTIGPATRSVTASLTLK